MSALVDDLAGAPEDLDALRAVFASHAEAPEGWPPHRPGVRAHALELLARGEGRRAALVLVAALEDLRRYFARADADDDGGWHRQQGKQWEAWALCRATRRVLVETDLRAAWRAEVLAALRELFGESELEGWPSASSLGPLSAKDEALLRGERGRRSNAPWEPPESGLAHRLRDVAPIDVDEVLGLLDRMFGRIADDESLMARADALRSVTALLLREGEHGAAAMAAVAALSLRGIEARDEELAGAIAISSEREAVLEEYLRAIEGALEAAVAAGGDEVRELVLDATSRAHAELERTVRRLFGRGDPSEAAAAVERLLEQREESEGDDRLEIELALVHDYGDVLDDDIFLAICRHRGWAEAAVRKLLARGRADEAYDFASGIFAVDPAGATSSVVAVARAFVDSGHPAHAERISRPYIDRSPECAELLARALSAQEKPEAREAWLRWFRMRPTVQTYAAIAEAVPAPEWPAFRDELRSHAATRRVLTTLVDIAVVDDDPKLLERILPDLSDSQRAHARARAGALVGRISKSAARALEAKAEPPPPPAVRESRPATPPPSHVSHPKFGEGRVLRSEGFGDAEKYVVDFGEHGERTILARFLKPVAPSEGGSA